MIELGGDLRALSPGRRAQIEHPVMRLHIQHLHRAGRAWLLQIKCPCGMQGMQAEMLAGHIK